MDVGRAVNVLNNLIKRDIESHNPVPDVTGMQGVLLHFIRSRGGECYSKEIEDAFCMRRATVCGYLALLEKNAMISREDVPGDKRLKKIILTDKARGYLVEIDENIARNERKLARNLTEKELEEFLAVAKKMTQNLID